MRRRKATIWNNFCSYWHANHWKLKLSSFALRHIISKYVVYPVLGYFLPVSADIHCLKVQNKNAQTIYCRCSCLFFFCFEQNAHAGFMSLSSTLNIKHITAVEDTERTSVHCSNVRIIDFEQALALCFTLLFHSKRNTSTKIQTTFQETKWMEKKRMIPGNMIIHRSKYCPWLRWYIICYFICCDIFPSSTEPVNRN